MYSVNDDVVYSSNGVCKIVEIADRDFSGENVSYYVLRPVVESKNMFYVPVDNENLTAKMRKLLTVDEVKSLINQMPDANCEWIDDEHTRKDTYRKIIAEGNRNELIEIIKILYQYKQQQIDINKKMHSSDENFLKDAENLLYDEFAYVLQIPRDQINDYIKNELEKEIA